MLSSFGSTSSTKTQYSVTTGQLSPEPAIDGFSLKARNLKHIPKTEKRQKHVLNRLALFGWSDKNLYRFLIYWGPMDTSQLYEKLTSKSIKDFDELLKRLSSLDKDEATKALTLFFASARFKLNVHKFDEHFTDGPNDGGIDFYYFEDKSFYIFLTKFSETPKKASESELCNEISKLKSTLLGNNNNPKLEHFLNLISRNKEDKESRLDIFWLTTNEVDENISDEIGKDLDEWRKKNNWSMLIKFKTVDRDAFDRVIFDVRHGYIPYTGRRELSLEDGQWLNTKLGINNIRVVIANIKIDEILSWFKEPKQINDFLQKNVREFLGKSGKVNRAIAKSYTQNPDWFWFKHN